MTEDVIGLEFGGFESGNPTSKIQKRPRRLKWVASFLLMLCLLVVSGSGAAAEESLIDRVSIECAIR